MDARIARMVKHCLTKVTRVERRMVYDSCAWDFIYILSLHKYTIFISYFLYTHVHRCTPM